MRFGKVNLPQVVGALVMSCLLMTAEGLRCYECNVWKAGYGNLCIQPRIRENCITCMKIETTIFMGFYKNTPRTSTVISRTCALSKAVPYKTGCVHTNMADGHSTRCYCNTELCNGASRQVFSGSLLMSTVVAVGALVFRRIVA
jgi:hypothetical protein